MGVFGVVYLIWNMISGKKYVGQTRQLLGKRIASHKHNKKSLIGKAFHKYGAENFRYGVIKSCSSKAEMDYWEKFFIATLKTKSPTGYNRTDGGDGTSGHVDSGETRKKKSVALKGVPKSLEHRAKIGLAQTGKKGHFSGHHHTEEALAKMKEANSGENHYNFGKHLSVEWCAKISANGRGETPYKNLSNEITERQLTYTAIANLLGLKINSVSLKMHGKKNFTAKDIAKLVEIFGKPAEYLMARTDNLPAITSEAERRIKISGSKRQNTPFKNLVDEIDNRQFTYNALSKLIGLSSGNFSLKMHGERNFTAKDIAKLVEIFGKPAEYLMKRDDME